LSIHHDAEGGKPVWELSRKTGEKRRETTGVEHSGAAVVGECVR